MKRRSFSLLAASTVLSSGVEFGRPRAAQASVTQDQVDLLKTTLTPWGSERAGNADGSIPAWTGGYTQVPEGWTSDQQEPDFFASDAVVVVIDKSNMAQYSDRLTDGVKAMMAKYDGFKIKVYPTHRTAAAPQWVYDNIAQNALRTTLSPKGGRFGFKNGYGGIPFPILDPDPDIAGPQIIWNHLTRWDGSTTNALYSSYVVVGGRLSLAGTFTLATRYPYYDPKGDLASFDGWEEWERLDYVSPPVLVGQVLAGWVPTDPGDQPTEDWEMLTGQGRVRKAPELTYDTPQATGGGISNYDESYGFYGAPDRYNWKLLEKKEMYIPYNNNALLNSDPNKVIGAQYIDPDAVRYELHRVYVLDAVLAPGERHTIPHRRLFVDEDNWHSILIDEWDANSELVKCCQNFNVVCPSLPGTIFGNQVVYNIQSDQYVVGTGLFTTPSNPGYSFKPVPVQFFDPKALAAQAQY